MISISQFTRTTLLYSLALSLTSIAIDSLHFYVLAEIPKIGVYNAGSRYITVARKGNRYCYQGVSIPHKRYAVAVGETIGSLSPYRDGLIIEGLKRRNRQLVLSQGENSLLVKFGQEEPQIYERAGDFNPNEVSKDFKKCLNNKGVVYMAVPGSGYKIR
ncbi:hypothetical protein [Chamaesiphon polymorphus]|uniref:Uncharacterized protein n=1 Tax=Chamaesiphon polymorphus CCALA 037 TaxID=2107692 RepID=A0A2T1GGA1_9CYAN|nr:hypothetical protein [Chamaesiphon polymorphus]PSB56674.1 hypothetical protein C7B77_11015 [Chamaesiphon polymorphus CCALA 037]